MTCLKRFLGAACLLLAVVAVLTISSTAIAEGIKRGTVTGETSAKGYDHPNEYIHLNAVQVADNMEPVMPHPEQEKAARTKLAKLKKRFGKKPNILIFLIDDVGWMDPGFNGGGGAVGNPTPTMDKLAQEGLILTSAYSTPSCSPTRATIHTGQNPLHHGLLAPPMYGQPGGIAGATTLPMLLQKLGYVTQGVGKWHMGENKGSLPQNVGYDDFYGFLSVSDMYTEWRDQYFNPEIALSPARFKYMEKLDFCKDNVHCTQADKDKCEAVYEIDLTSIQNLDQDWTAYSEKFIRNMKDGDKPFFLYHASRGCHFDNYPNDEYAGISPARTVYSDCMVELDNVLDRLVKTLDETGQLENTLVFFTSDNGPECEVPPHGRTPFRGCKGSSWEGGVRVPTFAYWKGMISPRRSDGIFDLADLFNTAISLAGTTGADIGKSVPQTTYIDGIDQTSFLLADDGESNRRSRIYTMNQYFTAARIDEFKFHFTVELQEAVFSRGNTGGFSGAIITETGGGLMTNLYTNPQEDVSVCVRHIPMMTPITNEIARYQAVLKKYPPQFKFGFAGNP